MRRVARAAWRIVPVRALVVVAGAYVAYVVVINALFVTGAFRAVLNRLSPEHAHFEWSRAYSTYPFHVHTEDFVLTGQDSHIQWYFAFDRADATFDLHDFFEHRVHMRSASVRGVVIRIRPKLEAASATPARVAKQPPIPGLALPIRPPPSPPGDPNDLWSVALDTCDGDDVREVWIDTLRVDDEGGVVHGAFVFEPERMIMVKPSTYRARDVSVTIDRTTVASTIAGVFGLTIHEHRFGSGHFFSQIDATAQARGRLGNWHVLDPALGGGAGAIEVAASVDHGELRDGSVVRARSDAWTYAAWPSVVSGTSRAYAGVEGGVVRAKIDTYGAAIARDGRVVARIPAILAVVSSHERDPTHTPRQWTATLDVPSAALPNLEALDGYFGHRVLDRGSARVVLHAELAPHTATAFQIALRDVVTEGQKGWWANASVSPLTYSFDGPASIRGTFVGKMRDASVPLAILGAPGIVRSLAPGGTYTFRADVHVGSAGFSLGDVRVNGDTLDVRAHYSHQGGGARGAALVEVPLTNLGVRIAGDDVSFVPFASRKWYAGTL